MTVAALTMVTVPGPMAVCARPVELPSAFWLSFGWMPPRLGALAPDAAARDLRAVKIGVAPGGERDEARASHRGASLLRYSIAWPPPDSFPVNPVPSRFSLFRCLRERRFHDATIKDGFLENRKLELIC
jgi:hypothetical protein